jgi:hypothetical protein
MQQIIYSSAALAPFGERELTELLTLARVNNGRLGVTGMLLYHEGSFLQALEGDEAVLDALFAKIGKDKRHHRVVTLMRREIEAPQFDQRKMGSLRRRACPRTCPASPTTSGCEAICSTAPTSQPACSAPSATGASAATSKLESERGREAPSGRRCDI